jgi:hypothetical protein
MLAADRIQKWTFPGNRPPSDMVSDKRRCKLSVGDRASFDLVRRQDELASARAIGTHSSAERGRMAWMI